MIKSIITIGTYIMLIAFSVVGCSGSDSEIKPQNNTTLTVYQYEWGVMPDYVFDFENVQITSNYLHSIIMSAFGEQVTNYYRVGTYYYITELDYFEIVIRIDENMYNEALAAVTNKYGYCSDLMLITHVNRITTN